MSSIVFPKLYTVRLCACVIVYILFWAFPQVISAREWRDETGKFSVEATFVTADDEHVILDSAKGELIMVRHDELSKRDRRYLARRPWEKKGQTSKGKNQTNENGQTNSQDDAGQAQESQKPTRRIDSTWNLLDGDVVKGHLFGFGTETLEVSRVRGDILVDGRNIDELPPAYRKIVPNVVSRADNVSTETLEQLEKHLADRGGGPFDYRFDGIRLVLSPEGEITIPIPLLEQKDAKLVAPGMRRWQAAQADDVSEEERDWVERRERLILDSYERDRREKTPRERQLNFLRLQLLATDAGITDMWQVVLYPPTLYGYPYTVLVPGRTSLAAQQRAISQFPKWRVGSARRLSDW